MSVATIHLLGPFRVEAPDGSDITPRGKRSKAILALLALAPGATRTRVFLQDKLWSDRSATQSSASLRQALSELRRHFRERGIDLIASDRTIVRLRRASVALDVDAPRSQTAHEQLLEGLDVGDQEFEEWLRLERTRWEDARRGPPADARDPPGGDESRTTRRAGLTSAARGEPAIVVRRFETVGSSERTALFAQGLSEEIFTLLGSMSGAFVTMKDTADGVGHAAYELTGTVREGDRLRVTAQLLATKSGECLWSGRFDYDTSANFDAQEEISRRVIEAAQITLRDGELAQIWSSSTTNLEAWEHFQRGRILEAAARRDSCLRACDQYTAAIAADPDFLPARISYGFCLVDQVRLGWSDDPADTIRRARAVEADIRARSHDHIFARALEAFLESVEGRSERAVELMGGVIRDAPESPELIAYFGLLVGYNGATDQEIALYERALGLTPYPPNWIRTNLALAYAISRRAGALAHLEAALATDPTSVRAHIGMVIHWMQEGDRAAAAEWGARLRALEPTFNPDRWRAPECYSDKTTHRRVADVLKSAGL